MFNPTKEMESLPNALKMLRQVIPNYIYIVSKGESIELPCSEGNVMEVLLDSNKYVYPDQDTLPGACYSIFFRQDDTGSRTVTFSSKFVFATGDENTVGATANSVSLLTFMVLSDGKCYCAPIKQY